MASNRIMECSSSSSSCHLIGRYDVFVSFRGEDTRNNFTGFLSEALRRKGIDAFKDDTNLKKGESIAPELLQAIEGSHIFVVVFSKNYASSTWCLRELAKILDCVETTGRRVLPIFYDVDPSEVRKQSGSYEKAFAEHQERFKGDKERMEEVQRWRAALTRVANLSGWDTRDKPQYAVIEEIVQKILKALPHKFSSLPNDNLVGMESRFEELAKLLRLESVNDVRVVGISGMSGIGKTTLGRALYERISHQYDFHCFIDDVSKICRDSGILGVQKQLLCQSLDEQNLEICNVSEGTCLVWTRLRHARALIVLDNVDQVEQLKMFTGSRETLLRECLSGGSRIIIISRDAHILRTYGVDDVYQVQPLDQLNAIQLFCRNAFKGNYIMSVYGNLIYDVLSHAQGHPLAIEVLGSSLFGRNVSQWRSQLARLRENKSKNIMDVLRISFDELDDTDKEIFLDIACCFHNHPEHHVREILDFRGFHPEYGLGVLLDKSLITIDDFGLIQMHGLLRDLGRGIVREKSPKEPRKWSRLWDYQDLRKVMSDNMAAENIEVVIVQLSSKDILETTIRADAISKMNHLKLLKLEKLKFSGSLTYISNELGYLDWHKYPFECLPPSFQPDNLVELLLCHSNIKQLWEGTKLLQNLRRLNLSHSKNLIEMPDLGGALNLESLNLEGCRQLRQIDPSVGLLRKLTFLNLKDCKNLISLPNNILGLNSLKYLSLSGCSKLYHIQLLLDELRDVEHSKKLCMDEAPIHSQSASFIVKRWFTWPLHLLYSKTHSVSSLLSSMPSFPLMRHLDLSFCNLLRIPSAIGNLRSLEWLNLMGNNFATLPSLKELSKLRYLDLQHCKHLKYLPELPSQTDLPSEIDDLLCPIDTQTGLFIFNCPELVERQRCSNMTIAWKIQIVQAFSYNESFLFVPRIESVIPGSEIPGWFNNQYVGMGNLINIDASSVANDDNWIGIAFCAVFMVRHERGTVLAMDPPKQIPKRQNATLRVGIPVLLDGDLVTDESEHIWLFYLTDQHCIPIIMTLEIKTRCNHGFHLEVKKYGYRWVYKEDLQLSNRKRKISAIE